VQRGFVLCAAASLWLGCELEIPCGACEHVVTWSLHEATAPIDTTLGAGGFEARVTLRVAGNSPGGSDRLSLSWTANLDPQLPDAAIVYHPSDITETFGVKVRVEGIEADERDDEQVLPVGFCELPTPRGWGGPELRDGAELRCHGADCARTIELAVTVVPYDEQVFGPREDQPLTLSFAASLLGEGRGVPDDARLQWSAIELRPLALPAQDSRNFCPSDEP
jgi:hypothetical protein